MNAPDGQFKAICAEFPEGQRDQLIPLLQAIQDRVGYISPEAMISIGEHLRLPVSKIYGVATFYNQFRFEARGKVHCQVCRGTACHVKGSSKVLDALCKSLKLEPGHTTRDGDYSVEVVACIGACGLAPVVTVNGEFHAGVTPDSVGRIVRQAGKDLKKHKVGSDVVHADGSGDGTWDDEDDETDDALRDRSGASTTAAAGADANA
ncbi:MAG: NAD(P)H-dependent oxidoreductase subunit E [Planctomycetota bacterium]